MVIGEFEQGSTSLRSKAPAGSRSSPPTAATAGHAHHCRSPPGSPTSSAGPGDTSRRSCASRSNCSLFADSTFFDTVLGVAKLPSHCPTDGCVLGEMVTWQPEVASTSDGGQDWDVHTAPGDYVGSYSWNCRPGEPGVSAPRAAPTGADGLDRSCVGAGDYWLSTPFGQLGPVQTTERWFSLVQATYNRGRLPAVSRPEPIRCIALGAPQPRCSTTRPSFMATLSPSLAASQAVADPDARGRSDFCPPQLGGGLPRFGRSSVWSDCDLYRDGSPSGQHHVRCGHGADLVGLASCAPSARPISRLPPSAT
jgi:hypothetical protein